MSKKVNQRKKLFGFFLSLPLIVFLLLLVAFPVFIGIKTSFTHDVLSDFQSHLNGIKNYRFLLRDSNFWYSLEFTIVFSLIVTTLEVTLGILLAIFFDKKFPGKKAAFSLILLPIMIAPSLMAVMFRLLLNENIGLVPYFLHKAHVNYQIFSPHKVIFSLVVLDILEYTAFTFLLSYSAFQNVPSEIHEAAALDGASRSRTYRQVILPMLKPMLYIILVLRLIDSIRTFDSVYVLTGGGPGNKTETIGIYIYKTAFINGNFGVAAAASIIMVLILVPFIPKILKLFALGDKK